MVNRAEFGGKVFCTPSYQTDKLNDNSWISLKQNVLRDQGRVQQEILFIGHIQNMYLHKLTSSDPAEFIIDCNWYEVVGTGTNGLQQVKYYKEYETDSYQFLDVCEPENLVCFPVNPFEFDFSDPTQYTDPDQLFDIIRHWHFNIHACNELRYF